MASLNTQLGYQPSRLKAYGLPQPSRQTQPSSGVTRALAGITPPLAAPSYTDPYDTVANPSGSLFQQPSYPTVQSTAPAGTLASYTPQTPQAPAAPAGYTFNLETDPILQMIHATAAKQRSEAEAGALEQRKQLAIGYGDQGYGKTIDENTGTAAAQNPFSVTANLASQYDKTGRNLNEQLNQHNLFYSGARINELAQALKDYQQQQASAAGQFQQGLGQIGQNRVASLMGADQQEQGGYNDAYARALAYALANPGVATPTTAAPTTLGGPPAGDATRWGATTNPTVAPVIDFSAGAGAGTPGGATPTAVPPELLRLLIR